jgi:quercetin dioxygenase-like cupin family protein
MNLSIYSVAKNEGPAVWFNNQLAIVKASGKQTGNRFCLVELLAPVGPGAPYHLHRLEDETFYILDGHMEFITGGQRIKAGPGSCTFLPRGIPHGFRVLGPTPARVLVLTAPAGFDSFVVEAGEPAKTLTLPEPKAPDMAKLMKLAAKYQIEIVGPLPE